MLKRLPRRNTWRNARFGLRRARVDAFRVCAMLIVIVAHSELALGRSDHPAVYGIQLFLNVVGRSAVPLFFLFAGEHIGPRLLRNRVPGAAWTYVRRLGLMFVVASVGYWLFDLARLVRSNGLGPGTAEIAARLAADPLKLLLYGARPHLWFLVVLILIVILAAPILARTRVRVFALGASVLYGIGLAIGPYATGVEAIPNHWWYEWALQSPIFFGLGVLFALEPQGKGWFGAAIGLMAAGLVTHAWEVYWLTTQHGASPFRLAMVIGTVTYVAGTAMLAFTPGATRPERFIARFAPYVPLVYLNHVFFVDLLRPPSGRYHDLVVRLGLPVAVTVMSFGSAGLLARFRHRLRGGRRTSVETDATDALAAATPTVPRPPPEPRPDAPLA